MKLRLHELIDTDQVWQTDHAHGAGAIAHVVTQLLAFAARPVSFYCRICRHVWAPPAALRCPQCDARYFTRRPHVFRLAVADHPAQGGQVHETFTVGLYDMPAEEGEPGGLEWRITKGETPNGPGSWAFVCGYTKRAEDRAYVSSKLLEELMIRTSAPYHPPVLHHVFLIPAQPRKPDFVWSGYSV